MAGSFEPWSFAAAVLAMVLAEFSVA